MFQCHCHFTAVRAVRFGVLVVIVIHRPFVPKIFLSFTLHSLFANKLHIINKFRQLNILFLLVARASVEQETVIGQRPKPPPPSFSMGVNINLISLSLELSYEMGWTLFLVM